MIHKIKTQSDLDEVANYLYSKQPKSDAPYEARVQWIERVGDMLECIIWNTPAGTCITDGDEGFESNWVTRFWRISRMGVDNV